MSVGWLLWGGLALVMLLDALAVRARMSKRPVLEPTDAPADPTHRFVTAPGVTLDDATRRAASALARTRGLAALHLLPGTAASSSAWVLAKVFGEKALRAAPLTPGAAGGHAFLVSEAIHARAQHDAIASVADFVTAERALKAYAGGAIDAAVVPGLPSAQPELIENRPLLAALLGGSDTVFVLGVPLYLAFLALGFFVEPLAALAAVVAHHVQQPLALAGGPIRARGVGLRLLAGTLIDAAAWVGIVRQAPWGDGEDPVEALRPAYAAEMSAGLDRFFEPRRDTCPLCDDAALSEHVTVPDLFQGKPGRFTLERCGGCGHIFQNPRLSLAGLDFYYRDFYDGLGERMMEQRFSLAVHPYAARAELVAAHGAPARWLDVGCGHGHFCAAARAVLPETRFEGLDLGEAVLEAERRGWIDAAHRGLFVERAESLAGRFDGVGMSHYLEHTLDPAAELRAAATVLDPGGLFFIEVPDPESPFARLLGWTWMPWLQPQHLHLLSRSNLTRLLHEAGFDPLVWHHGEAHAPIDLGAAALLFGARFAPLLPRVPWRPPPTRLDRARMCVVRTALAPVVVVAVLLDAALAPWMRRRPHSSSYRVLARRRG